MVYLFIGEDQFSKNIKLDKLKKDLFAKGLQAFNFDLLFARDLNLVKLQEALFRLPFKARKRLVLIRQAASLKEPLKKYLSSYIKKSNPKTLLVLDTERLDRRDTFLKAVEKSSTTFHFKTPEVQDTFKLSQQIDKKRILTSLEILSRLLSTGVRPEKIMGGLRYCWENNYLDTKTKERRLNLLLDCDISIKRGRLRPQIALERLLIELCRL
jgi:DNA polymerase III delta subunit